MWRKYFWNSDGSTLSKLVLVPASFINFPQPDVWGGDRIPGSHRWKWQPFSQFVKRLGWIYEDFFCSETGDQRDSWEAGGEGGRRRTVLLHCRGRQPCSWGEKNKCSSRHLGWLPGHHNGHSKFPGPLFPHIIIVRFSISLFWCSSSLDPGLLKCWLFCMSNHSGN